LLAVWNDARLLELIVKHWDESWGMDDLSTVVVARGEHRTRQTSRDAPDVEVIILPRCGRSLRSESGLPELRRVQSLLTFRRQGRQSSILRIHDERCLPGRSSCTLAPVSRRARRYASVRFHIFLKVG